MTQGDRPIESDRALVMEDEFEGEEEYEIIFNDDVMVTEEELSEESEASDSDQESDRKMSCVPSTDHASFVFQKHTGPVFCISINPQDEHMVISGGQDDKAYIWNTQTGDVLLSSSDSEFTDSVSHASFNHDGKYVAAADMGGTIKIWKTTSQPFQLVWENKIQDILWIRWHPLANVLLVGEAVGMVYMWKIPSGDCKILPDNIDITDAGSFMPDGKRAITCHLNGAVKVYNLATTNVIMKYDGPELNNDTIISLDVHPDNNLVALGSLTSKLYILKTQGAKNLHEYTCTEERNREGTDTSVECVSFSRNLPYNVVVAATDNALHVYDYVKYEERGSIPIEEGVTRLVWPEQSHIVYVGTKVGKVALCDVRALQRVATYEGHSKSILDISITKDRKTLVTASDDETVRIFQIEEIAINEGYPF